MRVEGVVYASRRSRLRHTTESRDASWVSIALSFSELLARLLVRTTPLWGVGGGEGPRMGTVRTPARVPNVFP